MRIRKESRMGRLESYHCVECEECCGELYIGRRISLFIKDSKGGGGVEPLPCLVYCEKGHANAITKKLLEEVTSTN